MSREAKGYKYGDFMVVGCKEHHSQNIFGDAFDTEWLSKEHEHDADFWGVYKMQGAIRTWLKDAISHREAVQFVRRCQDAAEVSKYHKEEADREYDLLHADYDLGAAL
jgi:hypothetical protein